MERDGNADMCCLCNQGGSLLCCDRCPASYHMRCIGEQAKSLPEGEWACPECAVGGRGKLAFSFHRVWRCYRPLPYMQDDLSSPAALALVSAGCASLALRHWRPQTCWNHSVC